MGDLIEHLSNPGAALSRVRELLEPGGELVKFLPECVWSPELHAVRRRAIPRGSRSRGKLQLLDSHKSPRPPRVPRHKHAHLSGLGTTECKVSCTHRRRPPRIASVPKVRGHVTYDCRHRVVPMAWITGRFGTGPNRRMTGHIISRAASPARSTAQDRYGQPTSARGDTTRWITDRPRAHAISPSASRRSSVHWNAAACSPDPYRLRTSKAKPVACTPASAAAPGSRGVSVTAASSS